VTAEAAEASGAAALYLAWQAIRSGMVDVAAVVGVEKVTDVVGAGQELNLLGASLDADYEDLRGTHSNRAGSLAAAEVSIREPVPARGSAGISDNCPQQCGQ